MKFKKIAVPQATALQEMCDEWGLVVKKGETGFVVGKSGEDIMVFFSDGFVITAPREYFKVGK